MALPTQKMQLTIEHVPTGFSVSFPAYLEMFSDAYTSQWNAEDVYGRMDPIATFINTRRALSIAWNVPAESYDDAKQNLRKVNKLMSFLYPLYEDEGTEGNGATAINQAPLLRISFGNLIRDAKTGRGLLGYVNGFTFDPSLEFGMFYNEPRKTTSAIKNVDMEYYPKTFRLNTEMNVLHEHSLGYKRSNSAGTKFSFRDPNIRNNNSNYPYATGLTKGERKEVFNALAGLQAAADTSNIDPEGVDAALASSALNKGNK
jgi:hypothetical protein